jgi:hypothetical protein
MERQHHWTFSHCLYGFPHALAIARSWNYSGVQSSTKIRATQGCSKYFNSKTKLRTYKDDRGKHVRGHKCTSIFGF